jgi:hypothetical protein
MKVIICGGRDFTDRGHAFRTLNKLHAERPITCVIEGAQRTRDKHTREIIGGADYWGMRWAKRNTIPCITVKADWDKHGNAAGPIRNNKMAEMKPDLVIAFKGGNGTADMVAKAKKAGIEVMEIECCVISLI